MIGDKIGTSNDLPDPVRTLDPGLRLFPLLESLGALCARRKLPCPGVAFLAGKAVARGAAYRPLAAALGSGHWRFPPSPLHE